MKWNTVHGIKKGTFGSRTILFAKFNNLANKMVLEPNVSPHMQRVKDYDVKECISTEETEKLKGFIFFLKIV